MTLQEERARLYVAMNRAIDLTSGDMRNLAARARTKTWKSYKTLERQASDTSDADELHALIGMMNDLLQELSEMKEVMT